MSKITRQNSYSQVSSTQSGYGADTEPSMDTESDSSTTLKSVSTLATSGGSQISWTSSQSRFRQELEANLDVIPRSSQDIDTDFNNSELPEWPSYSQPSQREEECVKQELVPEDSCSQPRQVDLVIPDVGHDYDGEYHGSPSRASSPAMTAIADDSPPGTPRAPSPSGMVHGANEVEHGHHGRNCEENTQPFPFPSSQPQLLSAQPSNASISTTHSTLVASESSSSESGQSGGSQDRLSDEPLDSFTVPLLQQPTLGLEPAIPHSASLQGVRTPIREMYGYSMGRPGQYPEFPLPQGGVSQAQARDSAMVPVEDLVEDEGYGGSVCGLNDYDDDGSQLRG
ncbi:hypothetical protein E1B28_002112 [Marasmius oreades]|uniref:Uncharacterized protein n=1 Tax=Marasmius oreades TaxID=181124 RepID=A0A9P7RMP1_9AGAR|nr:uncharacterized protein E1B28_002112 [Marasmius oreades]KAG7086152.1 hypothetical protein E1B28_002112 [Marasmius oreades]